MSHVSGYESHTATATWQLRAYYKALDSDATNPWLLVALSAKSANLQTGSDRQGIIHCQW